MQTCCWVWWDDHMVQPSKKRKWTESNCFSTHYLSDNAIVSLTSIVETLLFKRKKCYATNSLCNYVKFWQSKKIIQVQLSSAQAPIFLLILAFTLSAAKYIGFEIFWVSSFGGCWNWSQFHRSIRLSTDDLLYSWLCSCFVIVCSWETIRWSQRSLSLIRR